MPSGLMSVKEALEYAKKNLIGGLILLNNGKLLKYKNSSGNWTTIKVTPNLLLYHRGKGKWAVYNPQRDAKIISHKIPSTIKNKKRYMNYGDLNPEKTPNRKIKAVIIPGKARKKKKIVKVRKAPIGGGKNSL